MCGVVFFVSWSGYPDESVGVDDDGDSGCCDGECLSVWLSGWYVGDDDPGVSSFFVFVSEVVACLYVVSWDEDGVCACGLYFSF